MDLKRFETTLKDMVTKQKKLAEAFVKITVPGKTALPTPPTKK